MCGQGFANTRRPGKENSSSRCEPRSVELIFSHTLRNQLPQRSRRSHIPNWLVIEARFLFKPHKLEPRIEVHWHGRLILPPERRLTSWSGLQQPINLICDMRLARSKPANKLAQKQLYVLR